MKCRIVIITIIKQTHALYSYGKMRQDNSLFNTCLSSSVAVVQKYKTKATILNRFDERCKWDRVPNRGCILNFGTCCVL